MESVIYTASDLQSTKRRKILDQARSSCAQIRDKDGMGLVLLRQSSFDLLRSLRALFSKFVSLEAAFERPTAERRATDFGEFAWLTAFDEDDQQTFRREFLEAVSQSIASDSVEAVEQCIHDWRLSARVLSNEKSRRIHTSPGESLSAFTEVGKPERADGK